MSNKHSGHLHRTAGQLGSCLFYLRNADRIERFETLYPVPYLPQAESKTDHYWHQVIHALIRRIEWQLHRPLTNQFRSGVNSMYALFARHRANYLIAFPEQEDIVDSMPMPPTVDAPEMPPILIEREGVAMSDSEAFNEEFYLTYFNAVVDQVDAYRWMCMIDLCTINGHASDLPVLFEPTDLNYAAGWQAIEPLSLSLMRTLLSNDSERHQVRPTLGLYGPKIMIKRIAVLGDVMEIWLKERVRINQEKRNEQ